MIATPTRSPSQRMEALELANRIRIQRAQLKKDIRSGEASIYELIDNPPVWAGGMKVAHVLCAMRGVAEVRAQKLLTHAGVSDRKNLGGLSPRQRKALKQALRDVAEGVVRCQCGQPKNPKSKRCIRCSTGGNLRWAA